jgi:hypothetical protein
MPSSYSLPFEVVSVFQELILRKFTPLRQYLSTESHEFDGEVFRGLLGASTPQGADAPATTCRRLPYFAVYRSFDISGPTQEPSAAHRTGSGAAISICPVTIAKC